MIIYCFFVAVIYSLVLFCLTSVVSEIICKIGDMCRSNTQTHKLGTFLLFQKQQNLTEIGIKLYSSTICYRQRRKFENIDIHR